MKIHAVFNRDGGSFKTTDMDDYCRRAERIFGDAGNDLSCDVVAGEDICTALEKAAERDDVDALLAGGGDGTISAAAGICWRQEMPLGVVPAGTMNMFARSLGLPLDIDEALRVLAAGEIRNADIATANGKPYVHQFSVGMHARMVRLRNKKQYRSRLGKMCANVSSALEVVFNPPILRTVCDIDGSEESFRTSAISVSNNRFGADPLLYAEKIDGGELGIYVAKALTPGRAAGLAADILRGKLHKSEFVREFAARRIDMRFPKAPRRARAVIDGELVPLEREVSIEIHPGELQVLAPAASGQ